MVDKKNKKESGGSTLDQHLNERDRVIARLEARIEKITEKILELHDEMTYLKERQLDLIQHVKDHLKKK